MKDQFANYVVQKILDISNDKQCEVLLNRIKVHLPALRKYTYGKHIVARFEQLSGEGKPFLELFQFSLCKQLGKTETPSSIATTKLPMPYGAIKHIATF